MSTQKGNIAVIILGGALILALIAAGYFYWQTQQYQGEALGPYTPTTTPTPVPTIQDETANWKTYTNTTSGFEFKYPDYLQIDDFEDRVIFRAGKIIPISGACNEFNMAIIFASEDLNRKIPINAESSHLAGRSTKETTSHSSLEGFNCTDTSIFLTSRSNHEKNDLIVNMSRQSEKHSELFDQILSTFKFTN